MNNRIARPQSFYPLLLALGLSACGPSAEQKALQAAHLAAMERCAAAWGDKRWVPLRGSGWWLDATRLPWRMRGGQWTTDENCGAESTYAIFYWDGEKIRPTQVGMWPKGRGVLDPREIQSHWVNMQLSDMLIGDPEFAKKCTADPQACKRVVDARKERPTDRVVLLKNYPDFEVWLPRPEHLADGKLKGVSYLNFFFRDWPNEFGRPRVTTCHIGRKPNEMTREAIENIDLRQQPGYCQMEFWSFAFNGGSGRVVTDLKQLHQLKPALQALHQYLNASITREPPQ